MSQNLAAYFEKCALEQKHDYALRVMHANFYFMKSEPEKAFLLMRSLARDAAGSDYGEYAKLTLELNSCFDDSNRPEILYKSYDQLAQAIFDKKNRHNWDEAAIAEYAAMLKGRVREKWAPFSFIELLEYYYHGDDARNALATAEFISANYPQSWWDAKARARRLDIEYASLNSMIKRYRELFRLMEFKKGCGALQEQADVDEKLMLEDHIRDGMAAFEESVINLAQRYKHFKIAREPFFKLSELYEQSGSQRNVLRVLSHVNNNFNEYPDGAKAHFEIGMYYFRHENHQLALQFFTNYLQNYPGGRETAQATFMIGKTLQMQNRLAEAISYYKKCLAEGDPVWSKEASNSALEVCKSFYSAKKYSDALTYLSDMRAANFDESVMAEAAYLEGSCNRELSVAASSPAETIKFLQRAADNFIHLIERYPQSSQSALAKVALDEIQSGRVTDAMKITRISNAIIAAAVLGFFILLGVSYSRQSDPLFYFIFMLQAGFLAIIFLMAFSFKFFGKIWEILFG